MAIVVSKGRRCQDVPCAERGIVVGVDVSKGKMDFAALRAGEWTDSQEVGQDREGFEELGRFLWELSGDSISPLSGQRERHRHMCRILEMLEQVEGWQNELKQRMKELLAHLPEAQHLLSIPYVGVITVAGLLGECGDLRNYRNYRTLEKSIGLNLYEVSSGQRQGKRHISKRGRHLARYLLHQGAVLQMRQGALYYEYRVRQIPKGQHPNQIRVAIARKLLALLYAIGRELRDLQARRISLPPRGHPLP